MFVPCTGAASEFLALAAFRSRVVRGPMAHHVVGARQDSFLAFPLFCRVLCSSHRPVSGLEVRVKMTAFSFARSRCRSDHQLVRATHVCTYQLQGQDKACRHLQQQEPRGAGVQGLAGLRKAVSSCCSCRVAVPPPPPYCREVVRTTFTCGWAYTGDCLEGLIRSSAYDSKMSNKAKQIISSKQPGGRPQKETSPAMDHKSESCSRNVLGPLGVPWESDQVKSKADEKYFLLHTPKSSIFSWCLFTSTLFISTLFVCKIVTPYFIW